MSDISDTLKDLLGNNAEEKINSVMNALSSSESKDDTKTDDTPESVSSALGSFSPDLVMKAQGLMSALSSGGGDSRSRLLMSLKPYMRDNRRNTIDNAIKLLNIAQLAQVFMGGLNV